MPYNSKHPHASNYKSLVIAQNYSPAYANNSLHQWTALTFTLWALATLLSVWKA
jgi:hypothetical protein